MIAIQLCNSPVYHGPAVLTLSQCNRTSDACDMEPSPPLEQRGLAEGEEGDGSHSKVADRPRNEVRRLGYLRYTRKEITLYPAFRECLRRQP
jgi:hypothetical protein